MERCSFFFFTWITCHQMEIINPADYMDWGFPYPDCLSGGKMNFPEGFLPRILFGDAVHTTQYVVHQWANPSRSVWGEFKWGLEVFLVQCNETISSQYHWCDIWYMHTTPPHPPTPPPGNTYSANFFLLLLQAAVSVVVLWHTDDISKTMELFV